jgi:two-component system, OmpR family, response regulator
LKILIIEDDAETAKYLAQGLSEEGHVTGVSADGRDGLFRATGENWDLLIVDRMLPGLEGAHLVRTLRAGNITTPVLFLTTMSGVGDRVAGLNAGGDDYLVKPFAFAELVARVNALGRRRFGTPLGTVLRVGDLEMDLMSRAVRRAGEAVPLQPREFRLLAYLMHHAGEVVTRTMLLENVWDFHFEPRTNIVETHISRLRAKLHRPGAANPIQTVRGAGYLLHAAS